MLSVPIQESVLEVEAKFGPFTARQVVTIAIGLALSVAVGCWTWFVLGIPVTSTNVLLYVIAIPTALIGFVKPYGMRFEQIFPRWFSHAFDDQRIRYASSVALMDADEREKHARERMRRKASRKDSEAWLWPGCELMSPTAIVNGGEQHAIATRAKQGR